MDCSVCLEPVSENSKKLVCGHLFHLECILEWFVNSEQCPMCRACQKDDPLIKFKHKVIDNECKSESESEEDESESEEEEEPFDPDENFSYYRMRIRDVMLFLEEGDLVDSMRRAMVYESTMLDLVTYFRLSTPNAVTMMTYQNAHKLPENILDNWMYTESGSDQVRRATHYESTLEDLRDHFLMSQGHAEEMLEWQRRKREDISDWKALMSLWKTLVDKEQHERRQAAMRRAIANQATFDDLFVCTVLDRNESLDGMAYQHHLRVEALIERAMKHEDLTNEQAVSILEYQQARRTDQNNRSV